ncbi:helix-turn-helix transcriptional regulator [Zhenhengia yiwuensis]|uniref:helix-turn-helix transcriptional regulator n=1 Tax=Zhenhengia yiwuensis TaxID=2763666 RepID=UPI002A75C484|nr:helix-turn-helix transcriptional regulator [Zhenhengia yiwuensis]MDY3366485.1 helix-turn-helix transcriptional regulator [Zhenhengia yiwuensis]
MASKLKLKRIELDIKQKELALRVGITPQYLARLENSSAKNPSNKIMKDIAKELASTEQELFFED